MKMFASILTILTVMFFYMTFNVATVVTYVGLGSLVLYAGLEIMATTSSDIDYSWNTDRTMSIIYGASFALFSMSTSIFIINSL